jgi:anti-sigma-K factor RskA
VEAGTPGGARGARTRWALAGLGMLIVAALAVLIVVLARSSETSGPTVAVRTVAGQDANVRGTARLKGTGKGAQLALNVSHLPDPGRDSYEVWLFDSVADAVPLGRFNGTRIHLDRELPKDPAKYRWIDISLEPPDGNPNHSGESVARVKLSALRSR